MTIKHWKTLAKIFVISAGALSVPFWVEQVIALLGNSVSVKNKEGILLVLYLVFGMISFTTGTVIYIIDESSFKFKFLQSKKKRLAEAKKVEERKIPDMDLFTEAQLKKAFEFGLLKGSTTTIMELIANSNNTAKSAELICNEWFSGEGKGKIRPALKRSENGNKKQG